MLRRNPQSGAWERLEGTEWVPAHNVDETGLDLALDDAFEEADTSAAHEQDASTVAVAQSGVRPAGPAPVVADAGVPAEGSASPNGAALAAGADPGGPDGPGAGGDPGGVDDWELPGLVSTEGARSVGGQRGLRKRLQDKLRGKRGAQSSVTKRVEVGPRAAKPTGPAVKEGTEARQTRRRVKAADGAKPQRYVTKPPPALLGNRPRWMQDLFEAHFRSELTLGLRREHNRMKISRTDYAIGWLTLMDKLREDPSIARLKQ